MKQDQVGHIARRRILRHTHTALSIIAAMLIAGFVAHVATKAIGQAVYDYRMYGEME